MSSWVRISCLCIAAGLLVACTHGSTPAVTVIIGNVMDGATDTPLEGAEVVARSGSTVKASAFSDREGNYQLQFDVPSAEGAHAFVLSANLGGYRAVSTSFVVVKGKPSENSYPLRLVSNEVASCTRNTRPAVVVGHFRAPPGRPDPELSARIAAALQYDLDEKVQTTRLVNSNRPGIFACGDVAPKTAEKYGSFAKLLGVDAFVGGFITSPDPVKVKVQMSVADGYGVMTTPLNVTSPDVDLDDPSMARLAPEAMTAVMTALVIGYKISNKPEECVELVGVSQRLLATLPQTLVTLREECQSALPNRGLL